MTLPEDLFKQLQQPIGQGFPFPAGLGSQLQNIEQSQAAYRKRRDKGHSWIEPAFSWHRFWSRHSPQVCEVCDKKRCRQCVQFRLKERGHA